MKNINHVEIEKMIYNQYIYTKSQLDACVENDERMKFEYYIGMLHGLQTLLNRLEIKYPSQKELV